MKTQNKLFTASLVLLCCCCTRGGYTDKKASIYGTWHLVSGITIEKGDTAFVDYTSKQTGIKILNGSHFSFLRHDLTKGKDSLPIFVSGGGRYTLVGNKYTEHLEFCNYREWEDHKFDFTVTISNDTLIQSGVERIEKLGVDRMTIEKYIRMK